jgi:hypothetical protein
MFWSNWCNGFSGYNIFIAYYYAMHNVLNTIFLPILTRLFDNDVEYDATCEVSTVRSNPKLKQEVVNKIIGNEGGDQQFCLVRWFKLMWKHEEVVAGLGFEKNADGITTNNVAAYFAHARDNLARKSYQYFWFNFFWGFVVGAWVTYVSMFGSNGILETKTIVIDGVEYTDEGSWNDYWGFGCTMIYSLIAAHNSLWWIEIRSFNKLTIFTCIWAFFTFMPLTIMMNNGHNSNDRGVYFQNQFRNVYNLSKIHFIVLINAFMCIFPRYLWHFVEHSIVWPEFARVKSR